VLIPKLPRISNRGQAYFPTGMISYVRSICLLRKGDRSGYRFEELKMGMLSMQCD
jgi:hypothetical protein